MPEPLGERRRRRNARWRRPSVDRLHRRRHWLAFRTANVAIAARRRRHRRGSRSPTRRTRRDRVSWTTSPRTVQRRRRRLPHGGSGTRGRGSPRGRRARVRCSSRSSWLRRAPPRTRRRARGRGGCTRARSESTWPRPSPRRTARTRVRAARAGAFLRHRATCRGCAPVPALGAPAGPLGPGSLREQVTCGTSVRLLVTDMTSSGHELGRDRRCRPHAAGSPQRHARRPAPRRPRRARAARAGRPARPRSRRSSTT